MNNNIQYSNMNKICEVITDYVANGSFKSLKDNVKYLDTPSHAVLIRLVDYNNSFKEPYVYIDEHAYNFLSKTKLYGGEIIISNVGANAGTVFKVPKLNMPMSLAPNSIMIKTRECDNFYYYWLKSNAGQRAMRNIITSTAQPKFNKTDFKTIQVPVFKIEEQEKIADLLSSLDDKIEINNKINQELEELGQALYTKWFVNFDFPNEEGKPYKSSGGEMIESELGMIPKGWKVDKLESNLKTILGGTPPRKNDDCWNGDINWINSGKVANIRVFDSSEKISKLGLKYSEIMPEGTTLISITGNIYVSLLECNSCANQSVVGVLESESIPKEYIYYTIKSKVAEFRNLMTGAVQKHINKDVINNSLICLPEDTVLIEFKKIVYSLFDSMKSNNIENKKLEELRDFLIPQLMSGNLEIKDIEN